MDPDVPPPYGIPCNIPDRLWPSLTNLQPLPTGMYIPGQRVFEWRRQWEDKLERDIQRHSEAMLTALKEVSNINGRECAAPLPAKTPGKRRSARRVVEISEPKKFCLEEQENSPVLVSPVRVRASRSAAVKARNALTTSTKPARSTRQTAATNSIIRKKLSTHSKKCEHSPSNKVKGCYTKPANTPFFASTPAHTSSKKEKRISKNEKVMPPSSMKRSLRLRKSKSAFKRVYRAEGNSSYSPVSRARAALERNIKKQQAVTTPKPVDVGTPATVTKLDSTLKANDLELVASPLVTVNCIPAIPAAPLPPLPSGFKLAKLTTSQPSTKKQIIEEIEQNESFLEEIGSHEDSTRNNDETQEIVASTSVQKQAIINVPDTESPMVEDIESKKQFLQEKDRRSEQEIEEDSAKDTDEAMDEVQEIVVSRPVQKPAIINVSDTSLFDTSDAAWDTMLDDSVTEDQGVNASCLSLDSSIQQQGAPQENHRRCFSSTEKLAHKTRRNLVSTNAGNNSFIRRPGTGPATPGSASKFHVSIEEKKAKFAEKMKEEADRLKKRQDDLKAARERAIREKEERRAQVKAKKDAAEAERRRQIAARLEQQRATVEAWKKNQVETEKRKLQGQEQKRKEQEELERKKKLQEEKQKRLEKEERLRREDEECKKRQEELKRQREEIERTKREEAEKKRLEIEMKKKKEEAERIKREEMLEKQRLEEIEKKKREEAAERKRREELEKKAQKEADSRKRQKEELKRKAAEELMRKQREDEAERLKIEEQERKKQEEEVERKRREAEKKRQEETARKAAEKKLQQQEEATKCLAGSSAYGKMVPTVPPLSKPPPVAHCSSRSSDENYNIDDLDSNSDTDTEESPKKKVPSWATSGQLVNLYSKNLRTTGMAWWKVWRPPITIPVNLTEIFKTERKKSFSKRTSSAIWRTPPGKLNFK